MAKNFDVQGGNRSPDHAVAARAAQQHLQITAAQALACGLTRRAVAWRVDAGRWFRVHEGVFSVGAPPTTDEARWSAATLATGGVLSHRSAARAWSILDGTDPVVHVTVRRELRRAQDGIAVHQTRRLEPEDVTTVSGIPVTSLPRTLLDLAAASRRRELDRALREARARNLATDDDLRDVLARHPRRAGGPALAHALLGPFTRSQLERRLLRLVDEEGVARPQVNARVAGEECDLWWPSARLVVELDGRATHGITAAIARDAAKDARLRAAGLRVERLTWWDVVRDARRTAARLRDLASDCDA